jgi:tetratricopeptide (TPR) repeat protein
MPTGPQPPPHRAKDAQQAGRQAAAGRRGVEPPTRPRKGAIARGAQGARPPELANLALRLAIGREGIGLELAEPVELACLRVAELSTSLPGVRFPVDVSGGVTRFRHRRGDLQLLRLEIAARDVERWIAPKLRGLVGTRSPDVWIEVGRARSTVCVAASLDTDEPSPADRQLVGAPRRDVPVLAFDVHALAEQEDLVLVVANARGTGLPEAPMAVAIACVASLLGANARRSGAIFTLPCPAAALARTLFPAVGARVPATDGLRWSALGADGGSWLLLASRGADAATPTEDALLAREIASLLVEADEALVTGDESAARTGYVDALERAPRHAEIAARIIAIDARAPARAEAALATLAESRPRGDPGWGGLVAGELQAHIGDMGAAHASFERAGESERAPALAARAFELAARASDDPATAAHWLDRALARAPRSVQARWARVEARVALGRLEDALADVEHLEALARGARNKYAVWLRAGRAWEAAGLARHAGAIFERALRYVPDDPSALLGLGVALASDGREARGVSLLDRALEVARSRGDAESAIVLELARALAERLDDLPTAIAHVATIPMNASEAPMARGLEGRWRAVLGDLPGAALAFARLRDLAATLAPTIDGARARGIVALLIEAAALERDRRHDVLAAQRHLAVALRVLPHHVEGRRAYREAGAILAGDRDYDQGESPEEEHTSSPAPSLPRPAPAPVDRTPEMRLALADEPGDDEDVEKSARAEELTRRLRDAPDDDELASELAELLEDLGRSHELVALLVGRLEDASPERQASLRPVARATLERVAARADAAGNPADASLYRDALSALVP